MMTVLPARIVLEGWQPDRRLSLNGRARGDGANHWATRSKLTADAKALVFTGCWLKMRRFTRARVTITFVYPNKRRRDPDGLAGLVKPILDGMVAAEILPDDDCEHIELTLRARVEPGRTATEIELESI